MKNSSGVFSIGIIGFIINIAVILFVVWLFTEGYSYIQEKGLKNIVNEVWEGSDADSTKSVEKKTQK